MTREEADRIAREEYMHCEEQRRVDAERAGEADAMKMLKAAGATRRR